MGGRWYTVAIRFWGTSPGISKNNMKSPDRIWYDSAVSYVRPPLYVTCDDCGCFSKSCVKVWWINRCVFYLNESAKWVGTTDYITYAAPKNPTPGRCWAMKTGFWAPNKSQIGDFPDTLSRRAACSGFHCHQDCIESWKITVCLPLRAWTAERVTTCIQQGEIVAKNILTTKAQKWLLIIHKVQTFLTLL